MDKTTFLEELEKSLHVLKEEEIQDIIGEYEQHIDMKVKNGQTVEQAIADFGNVRELAAEILEAYHVRADEEMSETQEEREEASTEPNRNQKKVHVNLEQFRICVSNALARVKTWSQKAEKGVLGFGGWCRKQVLRPFHWLKAHGKRREMKMNDREKTTMAEPVAETNAGRKERKKQHLGSLAGAFGYACGQLWDLMIRAVCRCIRIFWNGCVIAVSCTIGILGLVALYLEGVLAVLWIKGYPLAGITIGGFGVILTLFAATGLCLTCYIRKAKNESEKESGITISKGMDGQNA